MLVGGAAGAAIAAIPPVAAFLASHGIAAATFSGTLGAGIGTITSADKGLIITMGVTMLGHNPTLRIYNIREQ
ncbi:Uncharacterised protein [Streptococcus acidominimus]|uniref:Uncharacterized protein n=1 Tax=Streptococcus acidominimus TaxID=1326 RepID=A0A239WRG6_STRAI|nr:hypothetical protein [Streptococcus acidominimus]SNV36224.1 Uncharacterised protein [Streptococcus acidominimus]